MIIAFELLTLAELEPLTCFGLTRFLSLHLARIACSKTFSLQLGFVLRINLDESSGNPKTYRLCLTFGSTAVKGDCDVIFVGNIEKVKRLKDNILQDFCLLYTSDAADE